MNPFDIKSVLLARHAQHVVLIHFPIALFIIGVAFDFVAQWRRKGTLAVAAYYNLLVAAVSTLPVVATGILAWRWQLESAKLKREFASSPGPGNRLHIPDLAGVVGSLPGPPPAGPPFAALPPAGRAGGDAFRHSHRTLRRVPQRRQRLDQIFDPATNLALN